MRSYRYPDRRARRVRRTITVDLGEHANAALEEALSALNSPEWRAITRHYPRDLVRGEVIRLALLTLREYLDGKPYPLHAAAGVPPPGR